MDAFEVTVMLDQVEQRLYEHQPRILNAQLPEAAVLIPITNDPEPHLIFTRRASHMNTHSGEVAFPGGKRDLEDESLVATALRESYEEIALPQHKVRVLGRTGSIISRFGLEVTPIVGIVESQTPLKANTAELDRIFQVPVSFFLDKKHVHYDHWKIRHQDYRMPSFVYGEYRIWGLTAVMLIEFLNITLDADIPLDAPHFSQRYLTP